MDLSANLWEEMQLQDTLDKLNALFPSAGLRAENLMEMLLAGELQGVLLEIGKAGKALLSINVQTLRELFVSLLLMGIVSAVFVKLAELSPQYKVAETSFYVVYLFQAATLTRCFTYLWEIADAGLDNIVTFVKLMLPCFLLAVSLATGTVTAGAGYQLFLVLIYGVENVLKGGFLSLITLFFLFSVLEGLEASERWEGLLDLLKKGTTGGGKAILGGIAAIGTLQALLTPAIDSLKGTAAERLVSALPGIGNGAESIWRMALGSAVLIRNGMGVLLLLLLFLLCVAPLAKILALALTLKLTSAIMGLVSDKRLSKAVDRAGETGLLIFGTTGLAMVLFWLAIAVTTVSVRL